MLRPQFERPQKNSGITIKQHIWPQRSIARFADSDGVVRLYDKIRRKPRPATPIDDIFCAKRVWDLRAERGYMKSIEDQFQAIVDEIIAGAITEIDDARITNYINYFFALWYFRA